MKLPELHKPVLPLPGTGSIGNISTNAAKIQYRRAGSFKIEQTGIDTMSYNNTLHRQTHSPEKRNLQGRNIEQLKENGGEPGVADSKHATGTKYGRAFVRGHTIDATNASKLIRKVTINDLC